MTATVRRLYRLCAPQLAQQQADAALAALIARLRQDTSHREAA